MNGVLHSDRNEFSSILERTKKLAEKRLNNQDELPAGVRVEGFHLQDMPEKGIGAKASIDFFEKHFADKMNNSAGARFYHRWLHSRVCGWRLVGECV